MGPAKISTCSIRSVNTVDDAIHQINLYLVDNAIGLPRNLSTG